MNKKDLLEKYPFYLYVLMVFIEPFFRKPYDIYNLNTKPLHWLEFTMLGLLIFSTILYRTKKQFFYYIFFFKLIFNPFSVAFNYTPSLIIAIPTYLTIFYNVYLHNNNRKKDKESLFSIKNQYIFIPLTALFVIFTIIGYLFTI